MFHILRLSMIYYAVPQISRLMISHISRLYLHEATIRLMAGASPGKTQLLLDRSALTKPNRRGLMCGKEREVYSGEREQAMALVMACRHLPTQLLASPGERSGTRNILP